MHIHPSITEDMIIAAVQEDDCLGFCISCGAEAYSVEPDARKYTCPVCGDPCVYGAEELLIHIAA